MGILKFGGRLLSNLTHAPVTRDYPSVPREYTDRTRGHVEFDPGDCILCNICGKKCPTKAIRMDKSERILTIDRMMCIQCGYCVESCPKKCLSMANTYTAPDVSRTVDRLAVPPRRTDENDGRARRAESESNALIIRYS